MQVELDTRGFRVDGLERPLVAAQFDPFRQNAMWWGRSLDAIKSAGIEIVSIFICWDFHEIRRGEFDFDGRTNSSRDLNGFLDLCARKRLLVWARPGPIMDDEWETRGPARDVMTLDRLHPEFLARTEEWIEAVCRILVPAQVSKGGPIALLSVDNEVLYPYSTPLEQATIDGDVHVPYIDAYYANAFREWLKAKYHTCGELNAVLGTEFVTWADVHSPRFGTDPIGYIYESYAFINGKIAEFIRLCRDMYLRQGIDVPMNTNMKQLLAYIDWPTIGKNLDSVGMNLCAPRDMPGDVALIANWWIRLQRAQFEFAWSADIQAGWIGLDDTFGFISPEHSEYVPMAAQVAGIRGVNFYTFVERDDWNYSPVNATGKVRPIRHAALSRVVASYSGIRQRDEQLCDVGLLYNISDHQSTYLGCGKDWSTLADHWANFAEPKASSAWWATFRALVEADVDFRIWIPGVSVGSEPRILIYAGLPVALTAELGYLAEGISASRVVVAVTEVADRTPGGLRDERVGTAVAAATREGRIVRCAAEHVVDLLPSLGARSFVRAQGGRIWTYLYRGEDMSLVLGAWNPSNDTFDGLLQLDPDLLEGPSDRWLVEEPRLSTSYVLEQGVTQIELTLLPHSARLLRLSNDESGAGDASGGGPDPAA
jgi:hypothetical protein